MLRGIVLAIGILMLLANVFMLELELWPALWLAVAGVATAGRAGKVEGSCGDRPLKAFRKGPRGGPRTVP